MVRVIQFEVPAQGFDNYVGELLRKNNIPDDDIINIQILSARGVTTSNGMRSIVYSVVVFVKDRGLTRDQILRSHY